MKKLLYIFALIVTSSAAALAQVHFNSGSARPNNPEAAKQAVAVKSSAKHRHPYVRCRDGSKSYSLQNVCTGHGGARPAVNK